MICGNDQHKNLHLKYSEQYSDAVCAPHFTFRVDFRENKFYLIINKKLSNSVIYYMNDSMMQQLHKFITPKTFLFRNDHFLTALINCAFFTLPIFQKFVFCKVRNLSRKVEETMRVQVNNSSWKDRTLTFHWP